MHDTELYFKAFCTSTPDSAEHLFATHTSDSEASFHAYHASPAQTPSIIVQLYVCVAVAQHHVSTLTCLLLCAAIASLCSALP